MKPFLIVCALLVATCSASYHGAVSTQYAHLDPNSHSYSYGYADPNSQKHETRSHDGVTHGSYSYIDGHGHKQTVSYTADPHHGFHAVGTNLPKGPAPALGHAVAAYDGGHGYASGHAYHGPQAHITLTHEGVPHDTPEVAHAKAAHAAAHAAAAAAAYDHGGHGGHHLYKRSLWGHGAYAHQAVAPIVLTHGGVPVDTPEVQHAKAAHYAAHAKALGAAGHGHGAPLDTPEVAHAKAAHFAAHAAASHGGPSHAIAAHGYHVPVIHNGVPVDTPEVQHAKAAHFAALAKASAAAVHSGGDDGSWDGGHISGGHGGPPTHYATSAHHVHGGPYHGPLHIPVIHNGVPVEPAEVQHARAAHLSALAAESHKSAGGYYGGGKW
ncbi:histidine-rich protein PFHRP-II [Lucilia sericata]|uniref:histidine-rich protein PFHRP-II n=1 Tax=Lucilia sericata TaxID=13632 RepID=UPI0018A80C03|nr:histidine-rich protein PFHRP-II [Lucilia sericata]